MGETPQAVPGERREARWGAGGGHGGGTEAGTEGASGLLEQPPLQHFMLLLSRLTHHLWERGTVRRRAVPH